MAANSATRIRLSPSFWRHDQGLPFSEDVVPSSLFLRNRQYLVVDIETKNTFQDVGGYENIKKLEISVACAYDSDSDKFTSYLEKDLPKLFELCYRRLIIGYNIKGFDIPVMSAYGLDPTRLDTFDLMYDLETQTRQRFMKLESVALGTLGIGKSADGLQAVQWWKEGKIDLITEYCIQDVKVTRDIFLFGRQNGHVKIARSEGDPKLVPVQWN